MPGYSLVLPAERPQTRPFARTFQRVRYHEISCGLLPRRLGNREQLFVTDTNLKFEFDDQTAKAPIAAQTIDQLRSADQAQPQLGLVALNFAGRAIKHRRPSRTNTVPASALRAKV